MKSRNPTSWLLLFLLPLGLAAIWQLQQRIDAQLISLHEEKDEIILRSGKMMKAMSLEYAPLMGHFYWTRTVQYYGDKKRTKERNVESLWPLLDVTTTLDPHLLIAYRFGSTFLSEPQPRGAGRPDLAIQLLERGIRENPEYWRFYQDLGYVYYFDLKDYKKAAEAFRIGSEKPGALIWMKVMAASIADKGESLDTSIFLWKEIYQSAKDPDIKKNAEFHLQLIQAKMDCQKIDEISDEFEKRTGHRPARINELVQAGLLPGVPVDPLGFRYVFDENGKAALNVESPLLEKQLISPGIK